MTSYPDRPANRLLEALDEGSYGRIKQHLELVPLRQGRTVYEPHGLTHVHFPTTAIVSALAVTATGASAEVAVIGNDGALGAMALAFGAPAPYKAVASCGGYAYRISLESIRQEWTRSASLRQALQRYLNVRMLEGAANLACNAHHSIEQRLCRSLVMRLDRFPSHAVMITHSMLATILGVRRPGVTKAALALREAGVVDYHRGSIHILDVDKLHQHACQCYATLKLQIAHLTA